MVKWMSKSIKVLFVLLFISSLVIPVGSCEDQYNHIWTAESPIPKSNGMFGYQLAIDGEYIITCEPYANIGDIKGAGKIYVYDLEGNLVNTLQSPEPGSVDNFGYRLDAHDGLLVAQDVADIDGLTWVGKVHVFKSDDSLQYTLQPQENYKGLYFGRSVAIGEEIILIGERSGDMTPSLSGKIHIYSHDGEFISTILPPDPIAGAHFGGTIEVGEDLIYFSQYGETGLESGPGFVYVYDYDGAHLMTLESPEKEMYACFGISVSVSGDKIVISEYKATVNGVKMAGKVHIYNTDGDYLRTLVSPNPDLNAWFGSSVAISGDIIVVGEELGNVNPFGEEGRAYVFNVDGTLLQNLTAPDPSPRGAFGLDVDIEDDIIVVGDCWAEVDGEPNSGRLHVFKLGAPVEVQEPVETTITETEPESEPSGGIPGYPVWSIGLALLLVSIFISRTLNDKNLILSQ